MATATRQKSARSYLSPIFSELRAGWLTEVRKIRDILLASAKNDTLLEEFGFSDAGQISILKRVIDVVGLFAEDGKSRIEQAERQASLDATPKIGQPNLGILLSAEGLSQVLSSLTAQAELIDDLSQSTQARVARLLSARYQSLGEFNRSVQKTFRLDRDDLINAFRDDVTKITTSMKDGRITSARFAEMMRERIRINYGKLYREGKGEPLNEADRRIIASQVESQMPFLQNWTQRISVDFGEGHPEFNRLDWRGGLYAQRGKALYEMGAVASMENQLIFWRLGIAEHCTVCPELARASPFTRRTLPTLPGAGDTPCLGNCHCFLEFE